MQKKTCTHHNNICFHSLILVFTVYRFIIHTRRFVSPPFSLSGSGINEGSIQMVWYPAWLLFLPIRYAMRTISTRPARAAPTMMGMSIWSWSI